VAGRGARLLIRPAMQALVRAALISNSPLVLAGLKTGLEQRGDFEIVSAWDGAQTVLDESFAQVQVGIVDVATDTDFQPIAAMAEQVPALVLLWPERDGPIVDWLGAGHSLLPRDASIEAIAAAAHAAAAGLVASTAELTAEALRAAAGQDRRALAEESEPLTPREREVLLKMSLGLGNREIAEALHISAHTAKFHVAQIIAKLDASSRAHAVAKGLRSGLVEL
jgi:DNA-binding NarL/FixJ family response regulator